LDPYIGSKIVRGWQDEMRAAAAREFLARDRLLSRRVARWVGRALATVGLAVRRLSRARRQPVAPSELASS